MGPSRSWLLLRGTYVLVHVPHIGRLRPLTGGPAQVRTGMVRASRTLRCCPRPPSTAADLGMAAQLTPIMGPCHHPPTVGSRSPHEDKGLRESPSALSTCHPAALRGPSPDPVDRHGWSGQLRQWPSVARSARALGGSASAPAAASPPQAPWHFQNARLPSVRPARRRARVPHGLRPVPGARASRDALVPA